MANGAMFCFQLVDGSKVYVDPSLVAFVQRMGDTARIVFAAGAEVTVMDQAATVSEVIRRFKQGEQE